MLEEDVRLDNQIQIGHNVHIGAHTAMAGCSAVAGSARIGRYCLIGGGAGILGHLESATVVVTAMSLVTRSIREPGEYSSGTPLMDNRSWRKNAARFKQLDAFVRARPHGNKGHRSRRWTEDKDMTDEPPPSQLPIDVATIKTLLPHRYPFLLVDRVIELEPDKRIVAYKNVTINEPFFQGHFPGHPVMPGVLMVEALAQAGGVLTSCRDSGGTRGQAVLPGEDRQRAFTQMVVPGDRLDLEVTLKRTSATWRCTPASPVDGEEAAAPKSSAPRQGRACVARPIHPSARRLRRDAGRRRAGRRVLLDRRRTSSSATAPVRPALQLARPDPHRPRQPLPRPRRDRRRAAGQEVRRRARRAGDRRPQHLPRVRHHQPRHRQGGGTTRIGDDNWLMAYTHVAHDCAVGNHVFSNNATLAGHVAIDDHVILSGFAGMHQFCRIGAHAFIGMGAFVNGDVPPFVMVAQEATAGRAASTPKA